MKIDSNILKKVFNRYFYFVIIVTGIFSIVYMINTCKIIRSCYQKSLHNFVIYQEQLKLNITNSNDFDYKYNLLSLCQNTNCEIIVDLYNGYSFISNKMINEQTVNILELSDLTINMFWNIGMIALTDKGFGVLFKDNRKLILVIVDLSDFNSFFIFTFSMIFTIMSISFLVISYRILNDYNKQNIMLITGKEAQVANKNMMLLTENLHHELRTPTSVIKSKVSKLKTILKLTSIMCNTNNNKESNYNYKIEKLMANTENDFNLLEISIEQIDTILTRMNDFKQIKHSNCTKSIKTLAEFAFKMMRMFNTYNFEYNIDGNLDKYCIDNTYLSNGDFTNILINLIKNSLEAHASNISLVEVKTENKILHLHIIDNGHGIKQNNFNHVFTPNFSTKGNGTEIRGMGLHLNKTILKNSNGNLRLLDSSMHGTKFKISVPFKINKGYK
jgi:signal transduction histidine kinase